VSDTIGRIAPAILEFIPHGDLDFKAVPKQGFCIFTKPVAFKLVLKPQPV
jgi:hypothetical protein